MNQMAVKIEDDADAPWYRLPFQMFQTNLLEVDADMDVEKTLDFIQGHGCNVWLVNGGGILSFYPTDLEYQTRNPLLAGRASGDLFGDAVKAAHRRGMRVLARMDFSKVSEVVADRHPNWLYVAPGGGRQIIEGQVSVDPSSDYYQKKMFDVVDEMINAYPLDGFFFNMFRFAEMDYAGRYWGVSQSQSAKDGFANFSGGKPHPTGPSSPHYDLWRTYADGVTKDVGSRIAQHVKHRRPNACVLRSDDLIFFEANNEVGRELWHHRTGERISAFRTQRPSRAVLCHSNIFVDMPYRIAGEEPEHMAQYIIQGMSRGANVSTYIMGAPGEIEYPALAIAGEITRFHRDNVDAYVDLKPASRVGLVRPDILATSIARHEDATAEFRGLYRSLQEKHVPFDVVPEEGIVDMATSGILGNYSVLVLSDIEALAPERAQALSEFVGMGGRLLLTGASGFDASGEALLEEMPVARITESTTDEQNLKSVYVTEKAPQDGRRYFSPISPVYGAHYQVEARAGAQPRMLLLPQAPFGPPEKSYGHQPDGTPGFYVSASGGVAVIPWTIGRSYHEIGLTTSRDIVFSLVTELLGNDSHLEAKLAEQVEITLQESPDLLVIHLINLSGARRKNFGPVIDLDGGALRLRGWSGATQARALVAGANCNTSLDGGDLVVELPRLGRFEVITVKKSKP